MSGRPSANQGLAVRFVRDGLTVTEAARRTGLAVSTVRRALRARGVAPGRPGRPKGLQGKLTF